MMLAGRLVSLACAVGALGWLVGPAAWEEAQALWYRLRVQRVVCRGCGHPVDVPLAHHQAGVPYCSPGCAEQYPFTYPEEYQP